MTDLILARAEMLCLETDLRRAAAAHQATKSIRRRLINAKAKVAQLEARFFD